MADIGKFFKVAAPFLSAGLSLVPGGGPAVAILKSVASSVLKQDLKPEELADKLTELSGTEAGRIQIKQMELEYSKAMSEMGFDHEEKVMELGNADRDSARKREMAVKDRIPGALALAVTLGFFGMLLIIGLHGIKPESHDLMVAMTATLGTSWLAVMGYYFGSSSGSAAKTELLAKAPAIGS